MKMWLYLHVSKKNFLDTIRNGGKCKRFTFFHVKWGRDSKYIKKVVPNLCLGRLTLNLKAVNTSYVLTLTEEVCLFRDTSTYFDSTLDLESRAMYFSNSKYE